MFPRIRQSAPSKSRERITIRENGLFKSREQVEIRENELSKSRKRINNLLERIRNPRERIAQFDITILITFAIFENPHVPSGLS